MLPRLWLPLPTRRKAEGTRTQRVLSSRPVCTPACLIYGGEACVLPAPSLHMACSQTSGSSLGIRRPGWRSPQGSRERLISGAGLSSPILPFSVGEAGMMGFVWSPYPAAHWAVVGGPNLCARFSQPHAQTRRPNAVRTRHLTPATRRSRRAAMVPAGRDRLCPPLTVNIDLWKGQNARRARQESAPQPPAASLPSNQAQRESRACRLV